jgi:site-specific DNA-methyltransferase (adenine-specific)
VKTSDPHNTHRASFGARPEGDDPALEALEQFIATRHDGGETTKLSIGREILQVTYRNDPAVYSDRASNKHASLGKLARCSELASRDINEDKLRRWVTAAIVERRLTTLRLPTKIAMSALARLYSLTDADLRSVVRAADGDYISKSTVERLLAQLAGKLHPVPDVAARTADCEIPDSAIPGSELALNSEPDVQARQPRRNTTSAGGTRPPDYDEFFTPSSVLEAARQFLGIIELDPASCEAAQQSVGATHFLSRADDALNKSWLASTVWLNPPYGRQENGTSTAGTWAAKLESEHIAGNVGEALLLCNDRGDTSWTQSLIATYPHCRLAERLKFGRPDGSTQKLPVGQVVYYLGTRTNDFARAFRTLGAIVQPVVIEEDGTGAEKKRAHTASETATDVEPGSSEMRPGDCLEVLKDVDDGTVNLIMTSPPYAQQRKNTYGGVPSAAYVEWWLPRAAEMWRVLKDTGSLVVNIREHAVHGERSTYVHDLIGAMRQVGWLWVDDYAWVKKNPAPGRWPSRLANGWERCLHFAKQRHPAFYADAVARPVGQWAKGRLATLSPNDKARATSGTGSGVGVRRANWVGRDTALPSNVITLAAECGNKGHPAVYPLGLPEFFVRLMTKPGDVVLDPFAGSGTTGVAATLLGRNFIGVEALPQYVELANRRLGKVPVLPRPRDQLRSARLAVCALHSVA